MKSLWPNFVHRLKIIGKFLSIQILVQALSVVSGILLVRTLDQQQYAYFTIANTMQSTMNSLADIGVGISLSAIGGKVWQDRYRFGQLINTAMRLRYYLAAISVPVVAPILIWMLIHNGASLTYAFLIFIVILVGLNFQLTADVLIVVPRLRSQISRIQKLDLISAFFRLIFLGLGYLTLLNAGVAIASSSLASGLQWFVLGGWVSENIDTELSVNNEDKKFIIKTIKNTLPSTIFFCFQGQLNIFLISIFGNTKSIAEIGALGRISIVFALINSVMNAIILPSFSRCQSSIILRKRYFQILGMFFLIGMLIICFAGIFSSELLWILGEKYNHLKNELVLMALLAVVNSFVGIMCSLNLSKAWVEYIWVEIPMRLALQVILLIFLDISTVKGIILLSLLSNISPFLVNGILTYRGLNTYKTT
ncbi:MULTISPECIES: lipopolysaccharide biosynthesis protein [unclassified Nostoc]|uniref:lipopolysaccharide biosynthesis protein n=1 Tax=unclassified Nostoc TaxID=2593658 RepID=UPI00263980D4|nr:polysaccharide biosynthesis protein [Nostoc sp. S13]MDF5735827.1 polysaccharide biosynthesis protein [Nostoc sp. S13]